MRSCASSWRTMMTKRKHKRKPAPEAPAPLGWPMGFAVPSERSRPLERPTDSPESLTLIDSLDFVICYDDEDIEPEIQARSYTLTMKGTI